MLGPKASPLDDIWVSWGLTNDGDQVSQCFTRIDVLAVNRIEATIWPRAKLKRSHCRVAAFCAKIVDENAHRVLHFEYNRAYAAHVPAGRPCPSQAPLFDISAFLDPADDIPADLRMSKGTPRNLDWLGLISA